MRFLSALVLLVLLLLPAQAEGEKRFLLATTTSTENSGLLDDIVARFTAKTGISINVVAVGTGQALEIGRRGDAAAILVHDRLGEDEFVANGYGTDRRDVMYNDFVIIGPKHDPAGIASAINVDDALRKIHDQQVIFASRGDDSGTHRRERRLWASIGLDPQNFGAWYRETGSGMGQTIVTATEMGAYTMTDRATWVKFNRKAGYDIIFENEPPLFNPYASIIVTNKALSEDRTRWATSWHQWLTSEEGRQAIRNYKVDGQQLFFIAGDETNG